MTVRPSDGVATDPEVAISGFAADLRATDLSPDLVNLGRTLLFDAIASAAAGRTMDDRPRIEATMRAIGGPGSTTIIGGGLASAITATFVNGFEITAATICDVHRKTLCHVTPVVVPAALAAAEAIDATGRDLLSAILVGAEITVRVAEALDGPTYVARGWHSPGVAGPFGAAAAVARLHGADAPTIRHALGHAGGQAAGTFAALGSSAVKVHQARGAVSGLLAGSLAIGGFDAGPRSLSAPRGGLLAAYADGGGDAGALTRDLGVDWRARGISLRRWPAASSLQSVIAAALEIGGRPGFDVRRVERIRIDLPPRAHALNASSGWSDQLSALQSARWVVAVALHDGAFWLEQIAPDRLIDPVIGTFAAERIDVEVDGSLSLAAARLRVTLDDGSTHETEVLVPPGDPTRPLDERELAEKWSNAASAAGLGHRADEVTAVIRSLEAAPSIAPLMALLREAAA